MKIIKLTDNIINKKTYFNSRLFIAADFETIQLNGIHYVYAIGYKYAIDSSEISDDMYINIDTENIKLDSNILIKKFIDKLLNIDKKKIIVYFHNFSGFDSYFIIDCINHFYKTNKKKIIIRDNKIYRIELQNILFLCTYLILPYKLNDIAKKWFKSSKIKFEVTKIKTITDIQIFFKEIKEYLINDVNILFNIINILVNKFIDLFNIDITYYYTISSISLAYYRKKYINDYDIDSTPSYMEEYIRLGYYGGLCNLHKTISDSTLFYYDVNSLYPFIMKTCEMPLGKGKYIYFTKENTLTDIQSFFGYISCDIYIPESLKIPPLPFKDYKSKSDVTVQANGYLKGIWFSEELKNAILLGCEIKKIYKVINYEKKAIIFHDYINDLYEKRIHSQNEIDNMLYKTIMNSLYGRFGLRKNKSLSKWFPDNDFLKNSQYYTSIIKEYGNNNEIINYIIDDELASSLKNSTTISEEKKEHIFSNYEKEKVKQKYYIMSVQISAAIASYSRIKLINDMYKHIKENNATIYYYDTDSIFTNKELNKNMVDDKKLGYYKLIKKIEKALFIAPKVYYLIDEENKKSTKFKGVKKKEELNYDDYYYFLKKKSKYNITDTSIRKNIHSFNIISSTLMREFNFDSKKYIKIYDENDIFIETKPIHIEKEYWDI